MASIYQENKLFINKYKTALASEFKKQEYNSGRINVRCNNNCNINMWVELIFDKDIYITEANKRLFFCVKLKEKSRKLVTQTDDYQNSIDELSLIAYTSGLDSVHDTDKDEIKKFLKSKGISKIYNTDIDDASWYNIKYWVQENFGEMKGYSGVDVYKPIIKELKECPLKVFRHPEVLKYIKEDDLIPVSWIELDGDYQTYLAHPVKSAGSRKSFAFVNRDLTKYCDLSSFPKMAHRAFVYTPYNYWVCVIPDSDIVNEQRTLIYNY